MACPRSVAQVRRKSMFRNLWITEHAVTCCVVAFSSREPAFTSLEYALGCGEDLTI